MVNKAYKIFNNQDLTIKYVLELKELLADEEKYNLSNKFLLEMMDLNEELMDAKMENNISILSKIKQSILDIQFNLFVVVKHLIESEVTDNFSEANFLEIKDYYFKKKYLNRILENIS